jgi:hypothetical protein
LKGAREGKLMVSGSQTDAAQIALEGSSNLNLHYVVASNMVLAQIPRQPTLDEKR